MNRLIKIFRTISAYYSYLKREDALFVKDARSCWKAISLRRYARARFANLFSAWPIFKADIKRALH